MVSLGQKKCLIVLLINGTNWTISFTNVLICLVLDYVEGTEKKLDFLNIPVYRHVFWTINISNVN